MVFISMWQLQYLSHLQILLHNPYRLPALLLDGISGKGRAITNDVVDR